MTTSPLPHNDYAETVTIGLAVLGMDSGAIMAELVADDFYSAANRIVFAAVRDLNDDGAPVDPLSVADRLRRDGNLDKIGGVAYLERCTNQALSIAQIDGAIWGVKDAAQLRKGSIICANASRELAGGVNAPEMIGEVQSKLLDLTARNKQIQAAPAREVMHGAVESIDQYANRSGVSGIPTGIRMLDYWTGGLQRGELVILAARPSMGKTSLMMQAAVHAALCRSRVYVFSLEMSLQQLALRMLCSDAQVDSHMVRTGRVTQTDRELLERAAAKLSECHMVLNDGSSDLNEILSVARREHQYGALDMVCVDYLQLIYTKFARGESRDREVGMITRQLKALAKELNCAVLCLSQLSRINESQKVKRPTLNALRDSGNIEQDADTVIFIHSDDYYAREDQNEQAQEWRSEVIIEKQRNGPTAELQMIFQRKFTRFYEVDTRQPAPAEAPGWYSN